MNSHERNIKIGGYTIFFMIATTYSRIPVDVIESQKTLKSMDAWYFLCLLRITREILKLNEARYFLHLRQTIHEFPWTSILKLKDARYFLHLLQTILFTNSRSISILKLNTVYDTFHARSTNDFRTMTRRDPPR